MGLAEREVAHPRGYGEPLAVPERHRPQEVLDADARCEERRGRPRGAAPGPRWPRHPPPAPPASGWVSSEVQPEGGLGVSAGSGTLRMASSSRPATDVGRARA